MTEEILRLMARAEQQAMPAGMGHSVSGKAWVNQILESNPVPTIWVTNRIEQIDPAFRRRFQYHLELKSPPPGAREALVLKALHAFSPESDTGGLETLRSGEAGDSMPGRPGRAARGSRRSPWRGSSRRGSRRAS